MDVARLYLGSIAGPLSAATPFNGYLIEHPKGAVLVDTGFGLTLGSAGPAGELVALGQRFPWVRRTTVEALADHGLEPGDVSYVVNTHLGDHSGDNDMFPEATFIVQRPEAEFIRAHHGMDDPRRNAWDFDGAKIELLGGEDAEILPGLRCLFTPGHSPGHQSIVLEDGGETTLFLGDAVYTIDIWDDPEQITETHPAFGMQVKAGLDTWLESVAKVKAVPADVIHFAHDSRYLHHGTTR